QACLFRLDGRGFDDRRPARDLVFHQRGEGLLTAPALSGISLPRLSRRFCVFSSSIALSSASLSLSRIGFGVPLGANRAFQADAWNCGSPASSEVGTSGSAELRLELPIAWALNAPP